MLKIINSNSCIAQINYKNSVKPNNNYTLLVMYLAKVVAENIYVVFTFLRLHHLRLMLTVNVYS